MSNRKFHFDYFACSPVSLRNIRLHQIGELFCEPGFTVEEHDQWCHEISYIVSGKGSFFIDGKELPVRAGDIVLSPRGCVHSIETDSREAMLYAYMGFDFAENTEKEYEPILKMFENPGNLRAKDNGDAEYLFARCMNELYGREDECWYTMMNSWVDAVLATACRAFGSGTEKACSALEFSTESRADAAVSAATRYIDSHVYELLNVSEVCEKLGYSKYYLSHTYKEKTGITLQQYLARKKILTAVALLENPIYTITMAAETLKYSDVSSFSRAFKRIMGVSPQAYMKNRKENRDNPVRQV